MRNKGEHVAYCSIWHLEQRTFTVTKSLAGVKYSEGGHVAYSTMTSRTKNMHGGKTAHGVNIVYQDRPGAMHVDRTGKKT